MVNGNEARRVALGMAGGAPVAIWESRDEILDARGRETAFEDFPNASTPAELLDVLDRLSWPPVQPLYFQDGIKPLEDPELLLDVFGLGPTRKNVNDAKDLLASRSCQHLEGPRYAIPLADLVAMARDMKALLTVLIYAYGKRARDHTYAALEVNAQRDFAFLYEWRGVRSAYGEYLQRVRYEDPHEIELDHDSIMEDIAKAVRMRDRRPARKTVECMRRFAEHYVNGFMWTVNPALSDGEYFSKSIGDGIGNVYDFWAEKIANGKALACPTCGKLVANPRKNQQFCSKSCGVTDFKKRPKK